MFGLNKPKGYITSTKDEKNRPTVYELLPAEKKKLIYIGRLDFNSEGLLLFTNNGDFSRLLEIPKSKIIRSYKVKVRGELREDQEKLSIKGLKIENVIHKFKKIINSIGNKNINGIIHCSGGAQTKILHFVGIAMRTGIDIKILSVHDSILSFGSNNFFFI